jgi:shikimate kinase
MAATRIALVGLRCSGKTTVGRLLAHQLGRELVDLDDALVGEAQRAFGDMRYESAGEFLREAGVEAFRDLEAHTLALMLAADRPLVLATGGGVVERPENRALLHERTTCVWLTCAPAELQERLRRSQVLRPPVLGTDPVSEVPDLALRRAPWYREVAALELDSGVLTPPELVQQILAGLP